MNFVPPNVTAPANVSIPSRGSGKGDKKIMTMTNQPSVFQSPLGEVVKETQSSVLLFPLLLVSIPSRGSGKGDVALLSAKKRTF